MNDAISALAGTLIGFLLPTIAGMIKSRTKGKRFANAVRQELVQAAEQIHRKMAWVSRDVAAERTGKDERRLVNCNGRVLFLGEPETFAVPLNFWQGNIRDIAEIVDTKRFDAICGQVALVRRYEAKFKDMKAAFDFTDQNPKEMALVCYRELIDIHNMLCPDRIIS
jgi:hypothetical protein